MNNQPDLSKKYCYIILETQFDDNGYIPSIVVEGEKGHSPLKGKGEFAEPWYWGKTFKEAQEFADRQNLKKFGIDKKERILLELQSMF